MILQAQKSTNETVVVGQPVSLVIPCRAEYIGLCRLVAGVVGTRGSLDAEDIADLKLVVTEACTCFLWEPDDDVLVWEPSRAEQSFRSMRVVFDVQPEAWEVTVSDPEGRHHIPMSGSSDPSGEDGLGLTIIKALVDIVDHHESETQGSVVRLVKRLVPQSAVVD